MRPPPGAFPAHHNLCVVDSQLVGVDLQEEQGGVAIFQIGGKRLLEGGAVFRGHHHGAVLFHQKAGMGQEHLLVHAMKMAPSVKPQDAGSAFLWPRVFCRAHDENPYVAIRGRDHSFLNGVQFARDHVRPPDSRSFLLSVIYRRKARARRESPSVHLAMQCVLWPRVCPCRPFGRRTPRFLQQILSCKRLLPLAVEDASKSLREMPGQSTPDEAGFAGWPATSPFTRS